MRFATWLILAFCALRQTAALGAVGALAALAYRD